ncbi:MAG: glycosyltransferase family 4 protein [Candidatus Kerfeldbacteria bacterium]|nr:glycosyltransferase family 4 protein [Candidatus Kerfeldbacteria bacterium]
MSTSSKPLIAFIGQKGISNVTGGVETHVRELSFRVAEKGFPVIVYARPYTTSKDEEMIGGVRVKRLPSLRTKHLDTITHTLLATLHAVWIGADIFHFQSIGPSLLAFVPRLFRPHARVMVTFHSIDREHGKWGRFAKWVLRCAEWTALTFPHVTITTSETNAAYARRTYNKDAIVIPTGVVRPVSRPAQKITEQFGLCANEYILIASRLIPHKNIHLVIEAFKQIQTDVTLAIAGDASYTDSYEASLRALSDGDDRIVFCGRQDGEMLEELFSNCLFYVNMSNSEGCPTATLEAMSYGKPVLVSSIPVNHEIAATAGTYALRNVQSIVQKLREMLARHDVLMARSPEIQEETLARFDWQTVVEKTTNVYLGLRYCKDANRAVQFMMPEKR